MARYNTHWPETQVYQKAEVLDNHTLDIPCCVIPPSSSVWFQISLIQRLNPDAILTATFKKALCICFILFWALVNFQYPKLWFHLFNDVLCGKTLLFCLFPISLLSDNFIRCHLLNTFTFSLLLISFQSQNISVCLVFLCSMLLITFSNLYFF